MTSNRIMSIREQIADVLRSDIISGELEPNTKLNEQLLAQRFGTSRGPIRDVLIKLTKEGLLVSKDNVGSSVNSILPPELQKLNVEIRRKIEEFAVKNLVNNISQNDLDNMDGIIEKMQSHFEKGEFTELTKADIDFHKYFVGLAGGDDLVNLWFPVVLRMRMNYQRIASSQKLVDEHKDIVQALREGNLKDAIASIRKNIK